MYVCMYVCMYVYICISTFSSDPLPSNLLPLCIDIIFPVITHIINLSLSSGIFPKEFKYSVVKPLLKKPHKILLT